MTIIPLFNVLLAPDTIIYQQKEAFESVAGRAPEVDDKVLLLLLKQSITKENYRDDSFYQVGVLCTVREVTGQGYFVMYVGDRVFIKNVTVNNGDIEVDYELLQNSDVLDIEDEKKRLKILKHSMVQFADKFKWGIAFRSFAAEWDSIAKVAVSLSPWFVNTPQEKYEIISNDSVVERSRMMEKLIYENLELLKINDEAQTAQRADYEKIYRESAIKKQISYLQGELDSMHPENVSEISEFEKKIAESGMNELAEKEAQKILKRLKQESSHSSESAMLYDYLDFITSLPWKSEESKTIDLANAQSILDKEHYGLKKPKKRIIEQLAVMALKGEETGSIICFVGAPGTGKTSIGASIAEALDRKYIRVSLGGVRDEADIRGHRRTYIGAMPGRILSGIQKCGSKNPVMVLDEVDKITSSYNGDPAAALLEVLDPEQNSNFTDHYLNVPFDLSSVMFICTANTLDTIPAPLLNRMEVIDFSGYTPFEKENIAKKHLIKKAMEKMGLKEDGLEITDSAIRHIISDYTRESGVRGLKKKIDQVCRQAAVNVVKDPEKNKKQIVDKDDLKDYIEGHPLHNKNVKDAAPKGVVTGLAWTSAGGDVLYIETMFIKGKPDIIITGQLGDVMKESASIAVSLVKSMFPESEKLFKTNTLHIHVPDGATPKDGPSAGITLTTALASLVTGVEVSPSVAMTGEVSLQGGIKPIGGLSEKLMAAQRHGVKRVFIPEDNVDDLEDVAKETLKALSIIPVKNVSDVLKRLKIMKTKVKLK